MSERGSERFGLYFYAHLNVYQPVGSLGSNFIIFAITLNQVSHHSSSDKHKAQAGVGAAPAAETPRPPGVVSAPAEEIGRGGGGLDVLGGGLQSER